MFCPDVSGLLRIFSLSGIVFESWLSRFLVVVLFLYFPFQSFYMFLLLPSHSRPCYVFLILSCSALLLFPICPHLFRQFCLGASFVCVLATSLRYSVRVLTFPMTPSPASRSGTPHLPGLLILFHLHTPSSNVSLRRSRVMMCGVLSCCPRIQGGCRLVIIIMPAIL